MSSFVKKYPAISLLVLASIFGTAPVLALATGLLPQGKTVAPGQTVDVQVGMTSPPANGTYRSDWG